MALVFRREVGRSSPLLKQPACAVRLCELPFWKNLIICQLGSTCGDKRPSGLRNGLDKTMQRIFGNLLATDLQRSISIRLPPSRSLSHTAFGYSSASAGSIGYLGLLHEPAGMLLLGNGHRGYWPELLRFGQPDSLSPFGDGGMNSYAYCLADPVNREDVNGRMSLLTLMMELWVRAKQVRALRRQIKLPSGPITATNAVRPVATVRPVDLASTVSSSQAVDSVRLPTRRYIQPEDTRVFPSETAATPARQVIPPVEGRRTDGTIEPSLPLLNLHRAPRIGPFNEAELSEIPLRRSSSQNSLSSIGSYDSVDEFEVTLVNGRRIVRTNQ